MAEWTTLEVSHRFDEAARTAKKLPSAKVQGYFNCWPDFNRLYTENLGAEQPHYRFPAEPAAIDRMLETTRWLLWLDEEQRHLIWMRAQRHPWREICHRFGCNRTTAWRRWQGALALVAFHLNKKMRHYLSADDIVLGTNGRID